MSLPTPPTGFEFFEEEVSAVPSPPPGFEAYKPSFRQKIMDIGKEVAPGLGRKAAFGVLRGLGNVAQEISGGLQTPKQIRLKATGLPGETSKDRIEREQGEALGEFMGSLGIPLGPVLPKVKGLIPKKGKEKLFQFLKEHGFSDKEITPFLQSEKKWSFLKNLAKKDKKTAKLLENIQERSGGIYETLKTQGAAEPGLNPDQYERFIEALGKEKKNIPLVFREKASKDIAELINSPMTNADLIQFNINLNARIGAKKGGPAAIGRLKRPVKEFMKELNPELAADYELANKLYSQGKKIASKLSPKNIDEFIEAGELFGIASGVATRNFGLLTKIVGLTGARALSREMLINPKLQRLANKLVTNIDKGNKKNVAKIMGKIAQEMKKDYPDVSNQIEKASLQQ